MKTWGIKIRPLEIDDLRSVFILGTELFSKKKSGFRHVWNEKVLAEILASGLELSLIAMRKKSVAGFLIGAAAMDDADEKMAEIAWIGIREPEGAELEHDLIEAFVACCAERHIRAIRIEVPGHDPDLGNVCREFGFIQTEQVLIMEHSVKDK